jgi:hypothetical protein
MKRNYREYYNYRELTSQCTKSRGLLNPPFLFMYWRYLRFTATWTAPLALPVTLKNTKNKVTTFALQRIDWLNSITLATIGCR